METIAIHQSRKSDKVIEFIELSVEKLSLRCSKEYARQIIRHHENGGLWGLYLTKAGRVKATFI